MLDEIDDLLRRKQQLDQRNEQANNMASFDRWLADSVELLLRIEAGRADDADEK